MLEVKALFVGAALAGVERGVHNHKEEVKEREST